MSYTCPRCDRTSHNPIDAEARYCGNCHNFESELLCFRLYVEGDLMSQDWVGPHDDVAAVGAQHAAISWRVEAAGLSWSLQIYDPERNRSIPVTRDEMILDVLATKLGLT